MLVGCYNSGVNESRTQGINTYRSDCPLGRDTIPSILSVNKSFWCLLSGAPLVLRYCWKMFFFWSSNGWDRIRCCSIGERSFPPRKIANLLITVLEKKNRKKIVLVNLHCDINSCYLTMTKLKSIPLSIPFCPLTTEETESVVIIIHLLLSLVGDCWPRLRA